MWIHAKMGNTRQLFPISHLAFTHQNVYYIKTYVLTYLHIHSVLPQSLQRLCFENKNKFPNEKSSLLRDIIFLLIPLLSSKGPLMGPSDLRVAFNWPLNDLLGTSKWPLRMSNLQMALMFLTRQMSFEWPLNSKRTLKWSFRFIAMQQNGVKPRSSEK